MESDIQALSARITRLELLLGPQQQKPCVHTAAKAALSNLRKHVPDEIAAAHRAVHLLSRVTMRPVSMIDVGDSIEALQQLDALQPSLRAPKHELDPAELANLQLRVARISNVVREEERVVDRLLADFDAVTTRLNYAITALAQQLSTKGD